MTLCPTCLHAVSDEYERCPFCSEDLGDAVSDELDENIEWRIIRTVSTEIEARLVAGRLQAGGIPAFVLSQVDSTRNFTVGALAVAKVFVPATLLAEAEAILRIPPDDPAANYPGASEEDEAGDDPGDSRNAGSYGANG